MNKQAYEHTVGLVLSKRADWDSFTGATKTWWDGLGEDTQRNIIAGGATAILGGILGGATGGIGGSLIGTIGGGLLGYHGMKHGKPQWDKWINYYNHNGQDPSKVSNGDTDTKGSNPAENTTAGQSLD